MSNNYKDSEVLLEVSHLKQYFRGGRADVKAVDDVSFQIHKGEVLGIVGESGCGKTTTGRSIIKLYDITGGKVSYDGQCISVGIQDLINQLKKARKDGNKEAISRLKSEISEGKRINKKYTSRNINKIQMIFQDPVASLNPRMTVREIIAEGLIIRKIKDKDFINKRVYEVLDLVGLVPEHADRYPHEFSGGQRQRIGIARAIVLLPELIIADEPISALDVSIQAQVINLLNGLRKKMGLTIMFVAHDLSVVKYFSDRIAVMYYGKIVELADSNELFENPCHPYTRSLLSAIPLPDPHYEKQRKRIIYTPVLDHDYSVESPSLREITPGHFVYCNTAEMEKYQKEITEKTIMQ
ncbi:MAG TPA: oligopeptide ABC transporter ATP-binding protein [Lachnoclostridium phytofermentans]|uniref:Oligopeptide ABC transporter ATP-binding protein n=1 Tax=Lachnoclostridium phytofermentans TaxID=66219 RepID=A0A3D2X1Z8_9FIRM|nr:ATP-binding cassette domain-containing protein [Lachnoclostridium sp.]HCL01151.1 oligopeptide ABC transporter ATP-binding protein [Lachnoclostridium phytofermentans]